MCCQSFRYAWQIFDHTEQVNSEGKKKSSDIYIYICIYTFMVLTALSKRSTKIIKNNGQSTELQGNMKHLHDFIIAKLAQCGFTSTDGTVHYSS